MVPGPLLDSWPESLLQKMELVPNLRLKERKKGEVHLQEGAAEQTRTTPAGHLSQREKNRARNSIKRVKETHTRLIDSKLRSVIETKWLSRSSTDWQTSNIWHTFRGKGTNTHMFTHVFTPFNARKEKCIFSNSGIFHLCTWRRTVNG